MFSVNDLLLQAVEETKHLHPGEVFLVKDLFKGYEWKRIPRNDRLLLGTLFLRQIQAADACIRPTEKTASGQQKYEVLE